MKLSDEREKKIRATLSLADDVEINEGHVDEYFAKVEAERAEEDMQRDMQNTAQIKKEVDEQLAPFYENGSMSEAQRKQWTQTIMRSDDPRKQLETVVGQLKTTFGDPAALPAEPAAQQQQQQTGVQGDPAAGDGDEEETDEEKAIKLFKQICEEGGNTEGAYKRAVVTVKDTFGMDTFRKISTPNQVDASQIGKDEKSSSFRRQLMGASTFRGLINDPVETKEERRKSNTLI